MRLRLNFSKLEVLNKSEKTAMLKRLIELAEIKPEELATKTGRSIDTVRKYISGSSYDYLFYFAVSYLAEENLLKIRNNNNH